MPALLLPFLEKFSHFSLKEQTLTEGLIVLLQIITGFSVVDNMKELFYTEQANTSR